jgi:hypothetical protein
MFSSKASFVTVTLFVILVYTVSLAVSDDCHNVMMLAMFGVSCSVSWYVSMDSILEFSYLRRQEIEN